MCDSANHVDALRRFRKQPKEVDAKGSISRGDTTIIIVGADGTERRVSPLFGLTPSIDELRRHSTKDKKSWPNDY